MRNRLFFFGDYQRTVDNSGYVVRATVPTMAMRNGDFSAVAQRIYDPFTGNVDGTGRVAFANNQIPQERISAITRRLLAFLPEPNFAATLGQNNFVQAQTREKTTDGFDAKVSHTLNERDQMSYRVSYMRPVVFDPGPLRHLRGTRQRRLRRDRHQHQQQHGDQLDPGLQLRQRCSTCAAA